MAKILKCWRKTLDEPSIVYYYNEKNKKRLRLESIFINNAPNEWQIRIGGSFFGKSGKIIRHSVKSKPQAIQIAKSYMRKHDKC